MRILAIINVYNLKDIPGYFFENLRCWSCQNIPDEWTLDIIISDCMSNESARSDISKISRQFSSNNKNFYTLHFSKNYPVYVTFNMCIKYFNRFNEYDYYIYNSEDCVFSSNNDLVTMINEFNYDNKISHLSGLVDNDHTNAYPHYNVFDPNGNPVYIKLGESVNMHFSIWNKFFMEKYDFKYVDILTAYATESIYTFLNAAIDTKWALCQKVRLRHLRNFKQKGYLGYDTYNNFRPVEEIFKNGVEYGLGFECWMQTIDPEKGKEWDGYKCFHQFNHDAYDHEGNCINKIQLYEYIKNNLFVPKNILCYDEEIKHVQLGIING